jgi:uncharacterized protein YkwD
MSDVSTPVVSRRLSVPVALTALAIAGFAPGAAEAASCEDENISIKKENLSKARAATRCLINNERTARGLSKLIKHDKLTTAAQRHSDDMVKRRFFDHVNPDGKTEADRVRDPGYNWRFVGENIAIDSSPLTVVKRWMDSPGHRSNILNRHYKDFGLGLAKGNSGGYFTNVFGAR